MPHIYKIELEEKCNLDLKSNEQPQLVVDSAGFVAKEACLSLNLISRDKLDQIQPLQLLVPNALITKCSIMVKVRQSNKLLPQLSHSSQDLPSLYQGNYQTSKHKLKQKYSKMEYKLNLEGFGGGVRRWKK